MTEISVFIAIILAVFNIIMCGREVGRIYTIADYAAGEYFIARIFAAMFSIFLFYTLVRQLINITAGKNDEQKSAARFFWGYLLFNLWMLVFTWPGIFKGDEFYMLPSIVNWRIRWTQSFYTCIFYRLSLMIFPFLAGITLVQIFIIAVIATDIFKLIRYKLQCKKLAWGIILPLAVLLPVIDNNLFTLRTSLMAWLFCDLAVSAYVYVKKGLFWKYKNQGKLILLSTFISAWKSEYSYLLLTFFLVYIGALIRRMINYRQFTALFLGVCVGFIIFTTPQRVAEPQGNYVMTSIFTPLSAILKENCEEIAVNEDLKNEYEIINSITPVDFVVQTTSGINLPAAYWGMEPVEEEQLSQWMKAAVKICAWYWKDFLKNRCHLYKYTNGMVQNVINHTGSEDAEIVLGLRYGGEYFFNTHFQYTDSPFGNEIRRAVVSLIACRNTKEYRVTNRLYPFMYNSFIPLLVLSVATIYMGLKRRWAEVILHLGIIAIVLITFLLAPAHFWMYYMPFYLTSYMIIMIYLMECIDRRIGHE